MTGAELQSRFARAVEAAYEQRCEHYQAMGVDPERAHALALEEAKLLGREALEQLRLRGLYPWADAVTPRPVGDELCSPVAPKAEEGGQS